MWKFAVISVALAGPVRAQVTQRVSVDSTGFGGNGASNTPSVSADGRFVAFTSAASNLAPGDTNGVADVYLHDRVLGTTERVSVDSHGIGAGGISDFASISADGRFVAFESYAANLVPGDTNNAWDVFVRDRLAGTTIRASVASGGGQGNGDSFAPSISANGRFVAFGTHASNLFPGDTNGVDDIVVHDLRQGVTELVSLSTGGARANNQSINPAISGDGRYVAFTSHANNLVPGDTNGGWDVFVRDRLSRTTERVSVDSSGAQCYSDPLVPNNVAISADGRFVAFDSRTATLVPGDTNAAFDVFVHDRVTGITERASVDSAGGQLDGDSGVPSISRDGRFVSFVSAQGIPGVQHMFVRDRSMGTTERIDLSTGGAQPDAESDALSSISADGRCVGFSSAASNLVSGDGNGVSDVFVRDRSASGFTSLCDPGSGGVLTCPCGNPPGGRDRGCDNSSATGGASLSASGIAYLSMDSLVFTTSGEKPTATSIVVRGDTLAGGGVVFGQGVRCAAGPLLRLYVKNAVAGSIRAPEGSDASVSARSAALGDVIQPGQSRWYLVYYRDPIVLGGCPANSTFNATQTGRVTWWP